MAPRQRSRIAKSDIRCSALDALAQVFEAEHPGREGRGIDTLVGVDRSPVDVAPRILRCVAPPPLRPRYHLAGAANPEPELRRAQIDPAAGGRGERIPGL